MKNNLISILILVSTIIGLGIFILPYSALKSGIYFYFWLLVIPILYFILHLAYGEIIFQIQEKHNLPYLVSKIINPKLKIPVWLIDIVGLTMVFLVYLIAIQEFINKIIFFNINLKFIFALIVFIIIYFRNNLFGKIDSLLSIILIIFCLFISGYLLPKVHIDNLINLNNNFLLSYGIILFSFTGYHSLQIVYDFLNKNKINFIRVNFYSLLFIFLIYLFYVLSTLGFLGSNVEVISLISLINYFQNNYFTYFSLFLFILSILTTFVSLAYYLKRGLIFDFGINEKISWFILGLVLILISFLNVADIIQIINFIGSLFVGLNLILILVCYLKLKDIKYFKIPRFFVYIMIFIFSLGWVIGLIMK